MRKKAKITAVRENSMGCVYVATNISNGKQYVGCTTKSLKDRMNGHISHAAQGRGTLFCNAIRKYGPELFQWDILCEHDDESTLINLEIYFMVYLDSLSPKGYNLMIGSPGRVNLLLSDEARKKLSKANIGKSPSLETREKLREIAKNMSPEQREKLAAAQRGKTHSAETRAKMSTAIKKSLESAEVRARIGAASRGRIVSAETRAKLSASSKGRTASAETRAKLSAAARNISDETRAKISASGKGRKLSPEHLKKLRASWEGKKHSPESRAKMSAALKKSWANRKSLRMHESERIER